MMRGDENVGWTPLTIEDENVGWTPLTIGDDSVTVTIQRVIEAKCPVNTGAQLPVLVGKSFAPIWSNIWDMTHPLGELHTQMCAMILRES